MPYKNNHSPYQDQAIADLKNRLQSQIPPLLGTNELKQFFPGISWKTLANLRSDPNAASPPFLRMGRKVIYERDDLINFLIETNRLSIHP